MGLKLGSLCFSRNQNNHGSSIVRCVCHLHLLQSKCEDKHAQNAAECAKIVDAFVLHLFFEYVISKNPKTPNLSPMADDAITRGGIQGLGSPAYICGPNTHKHTTHTTIVALGHHLVFHILSFHAPLCFICESTQI